MIQKYVYFLLLVMLFACNRTKSPIDLVDPFIGTGGHGHTFPGACAPFGMIQISPDTRLEGWDGCSGYHYSDSIIYGFSQTHLSGTGVSDYGDFLITPQSGEFHFFRGNDSISGYRASFSHKNESASPGTYQVKLDNGIKVEILAGKRTGKFRIDFPPGEQYLLLDVEHRDQLIDYQIRIIDDHTIAVFRRSSAWARDQRLYFVMSFSRPWENIFSEDGSIEPDKSENLGSPKIGIKFNSDAGSELGISVALSSNGFDAAVDNLEAEQRGSNWKKFQSYSRGLWEKELSKIQVMGKKEDMVKLYSSLYHCMIAPNLFSDADGKFLGRDLVTHQADHDYFTVFSLWDTYRALHPLLTIIDSSRTVDFVRTLILQYEKGGSLPVWELSANETMCMIGYHSVPVIADAVMKGYGGFDKEKALEACIHSSNLNHLGLREYRSYGFIPAGAEPESVSKTLEYAYDDWCIARFANHLGKDSIEEIYLERSQYWKNLLDPESRFFRGKINNGFITPFIPEEVNFHYTEANAWHYSMYVPQDIVGWKKMIGGEQGLEKFLDKLFTADERTEGRNQADITGLIGQYAHGNEPSQHMAYLYNHTNSPHKAQQYVRRILNDLYSTQPDGLPGNEDCGQMSAWFVMSALGFYPVCPGSNRYEIGSPLFNIAKIKVGENKWFEIMADNNSGSNIYVQSVTLNGVLLDRNWLLHEELMSGGTIEFEMGPEPSNWGQVSSKPSENKSKTSFLPVPYLKEDIRSFKDSSLVDLGHLDPEARIFFSINEKEFEEFVEPIVLRGTSNLKFFAEKDGIRSRALHSRLVKIPSERKISIEYPYANQYSAGGNEALIDGIRGGGKFATGDWQGYHGVNLEAVVDLGKSTRINKLSMGFLQDWNSWIFFPKQVQFFSSEDSVTWDLRGVEFTEVDPKEEGSLLQDFKLRRSFEARFIKVVAVNRGKNPDWHKAPGDVCWIFADELVIE